MNQPHFQFSWSFGKTQMFWKVLGGKSYQNFSLVPFEVVALWFSKIKYRGIWLPTLRRCIEPLCCGFYQEFRHTIVKCTSQGLLICGLRNLIGFLSNETSLGWMLCCRKFWFNFHPDSGHILHANSKLNFKLGNIFPCLPFHSKGLRNLHATEFLLSRWLLLHVVTKHVGPKRRLNFKTIQIPCTETSEFSFCQYGSKSIVVSLV